MTQQHFTAFLWMLPAAILAPFVALAASTVVMVFMVIFIAITLAVFVAALTAFIQNLFDTEEPQ